MPARMLDCGPRPSAGALWQPHRAGHALANRGWRTLAAIAKLKVRSAVAAAPPAGAVAIVAVIRVVVVTQVRMSIAVLAIQPAMFLPMFALKPSMQSTILPSRYVRIRTVHRPVHVVQILVHIAMLARKFAMILIVTRVQLSVFIRVVIVKVIGKCAVRSADHQRCCQHQTEGMSTHVCFLLS